MKEWYVELWEKNLFKFAGGEGLAYSKALATATVVTNMISLTLCMKLRVTRQVMYIRRTIQARLCDYWGSRNAVSITYPKCVCF
jgi:hypothetical protein